jgi:hypothetical protein
MVSSKHKVNICLGNDYSRHTDERMHMNLSDVPYLNDIMTTYMVH